MKLSVVIPAFNAERDLPGQLAALSAQEWDGEWEVVVADNGSTDRTVEVARTFARDLPALRVVDASEMSGQAFALNCGIAASTGEAILVLDADDEVAPGYVAAMAVALEDAAFVAARLDCDALNLPWVRESRPSAQTAGVGDAFGFLPAAVGCSLGLRRSLIDEHGDFDMAMPVCQDIDLSWRYGLAGVNVHFVADAVVRYRYRTDLGGIFRQARGYGVSGPLLYGRYRAAGMPRRSLHGQARFWLGPIRRLLRARTRGDFAAVVFLVGYRVGLLQGSWRAKVLYV